MLEKRLHDVFGNRLKTIGQVADVICGPFGSAITNKDYQETGIPLIRITNISKNGYMDYSDLIYISEELGDSLSRTQVSKGDIVISQRGSLGQCAIIDNKFGKLNISANIIAVKNFKGISADFVRNYILSSIGQTLLERASSGQVQQKITTQDIASMIIPVGCDEEKLSEIIRKAHSDYEDKIDKAEETLKNFGKEIICSCKLNNESNNKLCYAIKLCQLDGVIDAKRYISIGNIGHALTIDGICDIVECKVNAFKLGTEVVDWIRIDDLPNQPIDISKVRTQPANEIEGTFFEVAKGDILVARLGPTILNQKIVMVRKTERKTIASAEFLVLRCKKGVNPEAVMAILKTAYYRDIMYAHARGSTPSRYRLNREDMLKLPFPDILAKQEYWANKSIEIRKAVKKLRSEAERDWQQARKQFEKELLGE